MKGLKNATLFKQHCYIDGQWINANSGETISVLNPADGMVIGTVPACGKDEVQKAIASAHKAMEPWREMTSKDRSDILWEWARLIDENKEDLAIIMTVEQGKPLSESQGEIDYANSFIKWFSQEGRRVYGDIIPANKANQRLMVIKQPVGVVAAITPWNFPAAMITRKIAPALCVGCTVVVKPAKETPYSAFALAVLSEKAGFPKGVINILTGPSEILGQEMTTDPRIRKLSFTGSTAVGKTLMKQCAGTLKKITLELGGNAPFIVFEDADLDEAVKGAIASKFRNTGQTCVCANRILVQESIYDLFAQKLSKAISALKVGNGLDKGVDQGPLISQAALEKVKKHIKDAIDKGGKIILGGKPHALGGLFFEPTLLVDANEKMLLAQEETFGPVAPLFKFKNEKEAIMMANNTDFGLASYFYSNDINRQWRVSEALEYGMVGVNTGILSTEVAPFGGIKQSGMGREGSKYGVEPYLEIKYLCLELKKN